MSGRASIAALVGDTPVVPVALPGLARPVHVKLEGANPTGSVKDRACAHMVARAVARGEVEGRVLLDASSGNFACALAYQARLLGRRARVVSSSKLTDEKREYLELLGAQIELVGSFTIEGNERCREIAAAEPDRYCFLDQLHNWDNPAAHEATTGPELVRDNPDIGAVVASLGSGGTLAGVAAFLRANRPDVKIVSVEAAPGTRIPGTGAFADGDYVTPFIDRLRREGWVDERQQVEESDAASRTLELLDAGIFCGIQAGGLVQACIQSGICERVDGDVVLIAGDSGWKNLAKLRSIARR